MKLWRCITWYNISCVSTAGLMSPFNTWIMDKQYFMRYKVLIPVKMLMAVFWVVMMWGLVGGYQCITSIFKLANGDNTFHQNNGNHLQDHKASQPRRQSSASTAWIIRVSINKTTWYKHRYFLVNHVISLTSLFQLKPNTPEKRLPTLLHITVKLKHTII